MKRNTILKTLTATILGTAALQAQAQGIYVNKKSGESIAYPKAILDKVVPMKSGISVSTYEKGATATLEYEKIADMQTPRIGHQIFPSGDGFVVVGGHTTNFELTSTAEIYENGSWKNISISNPHDGAFSVTLSDGRVMVGGGFSSKNGVGQSKKTDIYNPATKSFTAGPDMSVARGCCKAVAIGDKVYVSGNWYADDKVIDYYDGSTFKSIGDMDGRSNPYMFYDKEGNIYSLSAYDTKGGDFGFYTDDEGDKALTGDVYVVSEDKTYYYRYWLYSQWVPLPLPADARAEDNAYYDGSYNFVVLTKNGDQYLLTEPCPDDNMTHNWNTFEIPSRHPVTDEVITYRGNVYNNAAKGEYYIIGCSGTTTNQTVHIISFSYKEGNYWTIASASGFDHDLMSSSWTLLSDGRLACTGGGIKNNFDAQKTSYIFTPPTAGLVESSSTMDYGVSVYKQDGSNDNYKESELESITTYEEEFDERITQEIPVEYLSKMNAHMPIYSGNTPPNIEGVYLWNPLVLVYDSKNSYPTGHQFDDYISEITNQDMSKNTLDYRDEQISNGSATVPSEKSEAKIVGEGDNFTMFVIPTTKYSDETWVKMASLFSGTKTDDGIKNFYQGFVVLDKGDPNHNFMDIGEFRVVNDQNGMSEPTTWLARQNAARKTDYHVGQDLTRSIMSKRPSVVVKEASLRMEKVKK